MIIKEGMKEIKIDTKAIRLIYRVFQENIDNLPIDRVEFTIICLLIIEGKLPLAQAEDTYWNWYNGGNKWIF